MDALYLFGQVAFTLALAYGCYLCLTNGHLSSKEGIEREFRTGLHLQLPIHPDDSIQEPKVANRLVFGFALDRSGRTNFHQSFLGGTTMPLATTIGRSGNYLLGVFSVIALGVLVWHAVSSSVPNAPAAANGAGAQAVPQEPAYYFPSLYVNQATEIEPAPPTF